MKMTERLAKLLVVASMALLASLVSFGNLTDYGSNLQFVEHVMRMDTTFPGNANMYRAITSPVVVCTQFWTRGRWNRLGLVGAGSE